MKYHIPSHVHHRAVHDEVVILDSRNDAYLGLNGSAAVIWATIVEGSVAEEAITALVSRFDVGESEARRDVEALVAELEARSLIERVA